MTIVRLPVSFFLSVVMTITLFWSLGILMASDPRGDVIPVIPSIRLAPTLIPEYPEPIRDFIPPPPPKPQPPSDDFGLLTDTKHVITGADAWKVLPEGVMFGEKDLAPTPRDHASIPDASGSNRGPVPQVRLEPDYPPQARDHGIEGWVTFRFTVTKEGRVKDVEIVDARPPRIWDSATIRAVSTWRYQPALKDGVPVEQVGVMATYRFELER
jgi:protein TonB